MAVRQDGKNYTPPRAIAEMERDLAPLMTFLGQDGDGIIGAPPDPALTELWARWFGTRAYIDEREAKSLVGSGDVIAPWGVSRDVSHRFGIVDAAGAWAWRNLLSRKTSVSVEWEAGEIIGLTPDANPILAQTEPELAKALSENAANGGRVVLKSLWSASGRGVRFFQNNLGSGEAEAYGRKCLSADGGVVVERALRRLAEFSYIFTPEAGGLKLEGINRYHSSESGGMGWELAGPQPLMYDLSPHKHVIEAGAEALRHVIGRKANEAGYVGPAGVDAMIYETEDGRRKLRCCTEVNMRHCMGHVAIRLNGAFADDTSVRWRMGHFGSADDWLNFCGKESASHPIVLDERGQISSGFFRLTGIGSGQRFGAFGWAGENGIAPPQ